jgi:DNA repair protein RecN (Recombination protein N)
MLKKLIIKNYALIDSLELDFSDGLTIITGETGAGKSIMLGALSMIMGGRADARVISDGGAKSVVEAFFANPPEDLKEMVTSLDLDWMDSELVIRREIASNGRSRAFVNDAPVTLTALSGISSRLIDIHSQHENARPLSGLVTISSSPRR